MSAFLISAALLVGIAACVTDLRNRTVPNWISGLALVAGVGYHLATAGWRGMVFSASAAACGFAVFLPFYLLGGIGAGDVKLTAGFGALLGLPGLWQAVLWTCLMGGLAAAMLVYWRRLKRLPAEQTAEVFKSDAIPYAPAIAAGAWMAMWVRS